MTELVGSFDLSNGEAAVRHLRHMPTWKRNQSYYIWVLYVYVMTSLINWHCCKSIRLHLYMLKIVFCWWYRLLNSLDSMGTFWFPMVLKKIFWFWWRKKKSDSEFLSYNLMLNSGNKLRDKKNKYSNSCCPKKFLWTKQKTIPPTPFKLNGRSQTSSKIGTMSFENVGWLL